MCLATFRELKHRAGSIQKGLSQVVWALHPAGDQDSLAFPRENPEARFWRSLMLQSCRLNYILHLFNGEERACHCLHQSNSNPQPSISLIFHSLPWALLEAQWLSGASMCGADTQRGGSSGSESYWCEHLNPSGSFKKRLKAKCLLTQSWSTGWNHQGILSHPCGLSARPHCLPVN